MTELSQFNLRLHENVNVIYHLRSRVTHSYSPGNRILVESNMTQMPRHVLYKGE